ncbi:MAG: hypothetical protein LBK42_02275 [Propionibacteriaceae bacterium]|nr:hypothetical protein [Propionibacteriaceae bacterium]
MTLVDPCSRKDELTDRDAESNKADDHIKTVRLALQQLSLHPTKKILMRMDGAGVTHDLVDWLEHSQHVSCLIGFTLPAIYQLIP